MHMMRRFDLLPLVIAGLNGAETLAVLPESAANWQQADPGSFALKEGISTAKGGMGH